MAQHIPGPEFDLWIVEDPDGETVTGGDAKDVMLGSDGDDILIGAGSDDTLTGAGGNDALVGGDGFDIAVYGDAADGITVDLGNLAAQDVGGGMGSDTLSGIEAVYGSNFNDVLIGDDSSTLVGDRLISNILLGNGGDDLLVGAGGDDFLMGGAGADTFKYSFSQAQAGSVETFTGWLAAQGLPASGWTQDFFAQKYSAFLQHLVETYDIGADVNGDGKISVDINQNAAGGTPRIEGLSAQELSSMFADRDSAMVKTGKTFHERWFSDTFQIGGGEQAATSADGHDAVLDFNLAEGDTLAFDGLEAMSEDQWHSVFSVTRIDADQDGSIDTQISLAGGDFSVTLAGVNELTDDEIYHAIHFS